MIRTLVLNYEYPPLGGGAGRVSEVLCRRLSLKGYRIKVLTSGVKNLFGEKKECGCEVIRLRTLRKGCGYSNTLEKISYIVSAILYAGKLVRTFRPSLVHAHFAIPSGIVAYYIKKRFSIPYIITSHGGDIPGFAPEADIYFKFFNRAFGIVWRNADVVVVLNRELREKVRKIYKVKRVEVIPNGIEIDGRGVVKESQGEEIRILFTGRLNKQKNLSFLIEALADFRSNSWRLYMVGDGPERDELERMIVEKGLTDRIVLKGWLTDGELRRLYSMSDIFCLPSFNEGISVAGLEAMAHGLAMLVSDNGGNREIVEEGVNGFVFKIGDKRDFLRKLEMLIGDRDRLKRMQKNSVRKAKEFDWNRIVEEYRKIYAGYGA